MICRDCGREIPENSIYCNWCGVKQLRERKKREEVKVPTPRQLPSGSWNIVLRAEGQSITEPTRELCLARARAIRAGFIEQKASCAGMTLSEAYDAYLSAREGVISPSTMSGYLKLKRSTFAALMNEPLSKLNSERVQQEVSLMALEGKSRKTIANAVGLLSSVMSAYAPDAKIEVRLPQKKKQEPRKVEEGEILAIMAAVHGTEIELPVLMGLWLGMRMSEIRGARFEDIRGDRLHICRAVVYDKDGRAVEKAPKTFSGDRWVDLPPEIKTLIASMGKKSGYIVQLSGTAIYKRFSRLLEKNGIAHCRFHDLRHANAAVMVRLGIDSRYAQERNGWASDRMYKQVYGYTVQSGMDSAAASINGYFANAFANATKKD